LRVALHWLPRNGVFARQIPLIIEAGIAAVIGVTADSPFGEPERAAGRWLPYLRLAAALALAAAAFGALAAGSASQHLDGHAVALAWPDRPPHDRGAAICAGLVFAAGLTVVTVRGARAWFR
jgi:hypothetical protein